MDIPNRKFSTRSSETPPKVYSDLVSLARGEKASNIEAAKSWLPKRGLFDGNKGQAHSLRSLLTNMKRSNGFEFTPEQIAKIQKIVCSDGNSRVSTAEIATILALADAKKTENGFESDDCIDAPSETGLDTATDEDIAEILGIFGQKVNLSDLSDKKFGTNRVDITQSEYDEFKDK